MAQHQEEPRTSRVKSYIDPRTELPQTWAMSPVTRTESVGLINPLAQSGWGPSLGEGEEDEQKQKQKQKTPSSAEGSLDAGGEAKTQTSLQSCESATERPTGAKRKRSSPTGPLLPLDYEEIRADIVKGSFIPLSRRSLVHCGDIQQEDIEGVLWRSNGADDVGGQHSEARVQPRRDEGR